MPITQSHVRFCTTSDGVRIAYSAAGNGPTIVRAPHWCTHLEYDWQSPILSRFLKELSQSRHLLRFDQRGCGLSDRDPPNVSLEGWLQDLEAVTDAAGADQFAIFGMSQGAAVAVEYAARHPDRVTHLLLLGGYVRGKLRRVATAKEIEDAEMQLKIVEVGWDRADPSYRQAFAMQYMPYASTQQTLALAELMKVSASGKDAARIMRGFFEIDVTDAAKRVNCPTLVLHARWDVRCPFDEGRLLASLIPGARFVPLETRNHVLLQDEPAFNTFVEEMNAFLPSATNMKSPLASLSKGAAGIAEWVSKLTARERAILEHLARGADNAQIAAHLGLSEKTIRNYMTRVFEKLGVENRGRAIVLAREAGLGEQKS